jgi:NTP pyrophosphatase (non-canonical NTP hydrolase)
VLAKIREETDEIEAALDSRKPAAIVEEIGDLLFSVANLARHVSPPLLGSKGHPALRELLCGGG